MSIAAASHPAKIYCCVVLPETLCLTLAALSGMERVWEDLRQCHRLRNEMAHLVTSCQAYIMFEVLEAAWTAFLQKLTTTQDLDGLIRELLQTILLL